MKIAIVGSGAMARVRAKAFRAQGGNLCCITSKHRSRAEALARELGIPHVVDTPQELLAFAPDAVLIEVPHKAQDNITLWALQSGLHALVGSCLASTVTAARQICDLAQAHGLVVEAGYEARYQEVWERTREALYAGQLGDVVAVRSLAVYPADPQSWYYSEEQSGGMVLTHMTYAFLNPIRWIFGVPTHVCAYANQIKHIGIPSVRHETCTANIRLPDNVVCNMMASYAAAAQGEFWQVSIFGTQGRLDLMPGDVLPGQMRLYLLGQQAEFHERAPTHAFERQAATFMSAILGQGQCRNPPEDASLDVQLAEAIVRSIESGENVPFPRVPMNEKPLSMN